MEKGVKRTWVEQTGAMWYTGINVVSELNKGYKSVMGNH